MKKPSLRVTRWLGEIPVAATCTSCPDAVFRVASTHHRPKKAEYQEWLQRAFDRHLLDAHGQGEVRPPSGGGALSAGS